MKPEKPKRFDFNLVVIGAGSAGLVTSYLSASVGARVLLVERHKMGGDCLNTGCVPSKALIRSAKILSYTKRGPDYGFDGITVDFDFARIMERTQAVIEEIAPHDSVERYESLGVECRLEEARILDPWRIQVGKEVVTARKMVIATGAGPRIPSILGIEGVDYLTSETIWNLREKPARLLILGAGPIGCELAQAFVRLGVPVTLLDRGNRILRREDEDVSRLLEQALREEGLELNLNCEPLRFVGKDRLIVGHEGGERELSFSHLLLAMGRKPRTEGFGLEELGLILNEDGTIKTDPYLRTNIPTIYAAGDVAGPHQLTHWAAHQAWYAAVNALFGFFKRFKVDDRVVPWCTYSDPEVARVGLSEAEAKARRIPHEVTRFELAGLDRAICEGEQKGFVKVLTPPGRDRILGVTLVGLHAGDLIAEFVLAMKHGIGLNKILGTIHAYPTLAEANKMTAGAWKRAHLPQGMLKWAKRYLAKLRG